MSYAIKLSYHATTRRNDSFFDRLQREGQSPSLCSGNVIYPEILFCPACVAADGLEGLLADVVLDFAGIGLGGLRVHTQMDQKPGQGLVPVQHAGGDGHPRLRQGDEPLLVHGDVPAFPQALGGVADAGLGHAQILRNVNGANVAMLLLHHQHGFQVILRGSQDLHGKQYQPSRKIIYRLAYFNQNCKEEKFFRKKG